MSQQFPKLDQIRITVDETTREKHLSAVGSALRARGQVSRKSGPVLALALVLVLLVPVMALAAENTVPGDLLYPIKLAIEPVVQAFDNDAPAQRRVREVEALFERDAPDEVIVKHVDVARDLISDYDAVLTTRIDRVVDDLDLRRSNRMEADKPSRQKPPAPAEDVGESESKVSITSTTIHETSDTRHPGHRDGEADGQVGDGQETDGRGGDGQ